MTRAQANFRYVIRPLLAVEMSQQISPTQIIRTQFHVVKRKQSVVRRVVRFTVTTVKCSYWVVLPLLMDYFSIFQPFITQRENNFLSFHSDTEKMCVSYLEWLKQTRLKTRSFTKPGKPPTMHRGCHGWRSMCARGEDRNNKAREECRVALGSGAKSLITL